MRRQEIETKRAIKFCVDRERYLNEKDTKRWQKRSSKCPVCKKKLNHRTKGKLSSLRETALFELRENSISRGNSGIHWTRRCEIMSFLFETS